MTRRSIDDIVDETRARYERVDPVRAAALREEGGLLVDIRPVAMRRRDGEVPDALIVDRNQLEWRLDPASPARLSVVDESTYERPVVLFCEEGYASTLAVASLRAVGLRGATDMIGGFRAWVSAGRPVTPSGG